jgi:hypothetical protein
MVGYASESLAEIVVLCPGSQTGVGRCEDNEDTFLFTLSSGRGEYFREQTRPGQARDLRALVKDWRSLSLFDTNRFVFSI